MRSAPAAAAAMRSHTTTDGSGMPDLQRLMDDFLRDDAGSPLGIGMPGGAALRANGQSHYEAWQSLLRRDPCSYCGGCETSGTVDHVDAHEVTAHLRVGRAAA